MILFVPNTVNLMIGTTLCGIGFYCCYATLALYAGQAAPPRMVATCTTFVTGFSMLGVYMSSYYIEIAGKLLRWRSSVESAFLGCILFSVPLSILCVIFRRKLVPMDSH